MSSADHRHAQAETLLAGLRARHEVLKHCRPLDEESIAEELLAAHPDEEQWLVRLAVHVHVNSDAYLQSLTHGGPRFNLAGGEAGSVSASDRHRARHLLKHHRARRTRHA